MELKELTEKMIEILKVKDTNDMSEKLFEVVKNNDIEVYGRRDSNNNIIAQLGSLQDYGVHADEAIVTYLNRSPSGIFLIQSFVAILQLYWMKVAIDNLAIGSYTSIVTYLDGIP